MLFQTRLVRHKQIFEFLELGDVHRAVGKVVVDSIDRGFDGGELPLQLVNIRLLVTGGGGLAMSCRMRYSSISDLPVPVEPQT